MPTSVDVISDTERLNAFVATRTALSRRRFVTTSSFVNLFMLPALAAGFATYFVLKALFGHPGIALVGGVGIYAAICAGGYRWARTVGARRVAAHRAAVNEALRGIDGICSDPESIPAEDVVRAVIELGRDGQSYATAEALIEGFGFEIGAAQYVCRETFNIAGVQRVSDEAARAAADLAVQMLDPDYGRVFNLVRNGWVASNTKPSSSFTAATSVENSTMTRARFAANLADTLAMAPGAFEVFFTLVDDIPEMCSQHELADIAETAIAVVA